MAFSYIMHYSIGSENFIIYRYDDLPRQMSPLDLHYFDEAVDYMTCHQNVTPGGVGVIGISKGAEIALHMAITREVVKVGLSQ